MNKATINLETGETILEEYTAEEINQIQAELLRTGFEVLRQQRNARLADTDWTVLGDSPTPTAAWKAYRQALRDLPANTTDPYNVVWPTPPS